MLGGKHSQGRQKIQKIFNKFQDAVDFDEHSWVQEKAKTEPAGSDTILSVEFSEYMLAYDQRNKNSAKPRQKGYNTTWDRVNKFVQWFGPERKVADVTTEDWVDYLESGGSGMKVIRVSSASLFRNGRNLGSREQT